MRSVIIVLAKAPEPGKVKTRLIPPLTSDQAASLHTAVTADTVENLLGLDGFNLELHTSLPTDAWPYLGVTRYTQCPGHLPLKMFHALEDGLSRGFTSVTLLGSDSPTLPRTLVADLQNAASDIALGPAQDGGFWGITARRIHPQMFDGVEWSSPETLVQTVSALERVGLSWSLGETWWDVDEPCDLMRLQADPDLPRHTAEWFARECPNLGGASESTRSAG